MQTAQILLNAGRRKYIAQNKTLHTAYVITVLLPFQTNSMEQNLS
jgi:hypothetical protein